MSFTADTKNVKNKNELEQNSKNVLEKLSHVVTKSSRGSCKFPEMLMALLLYNWSVTVQFPRLRGGIYYFNLLPRVLDPPRKTDTPDNEIFVIYVLKFLCFYYLPYLCIKLYFTLFYILLLIRPLSGYINKSINWFPCLDSYFYSSPLFTLLLFIQTIVSIYLISYLTIYYI